MKMNRAIASFYLLNFGCLTVERALPANGLDGGGGGRKRGVLNGLDLTCSFSIPTSSSLSSLPKCWRVCDGVLLAPTCSPFPPSQDFTLASENEN